MSSLHLLFVSITFEVECTHKTTDSNGADECVNDIPAVIEAAAVVNGVPAPHGLPFDGDYEQ
jgi:hypothetical protein